MVICNTTRDQWTFGLVQKFPVWPRFSRNCPALGWYLFYHMPCQGHVKMLSRPHQAKIYAIRVLWRPNVSAFQPSFKIVSRMYLGCLLCNEVRKVIYYNEVSIFLNEVPIIWLLLVNAFGHRAEIVYQTLSTLGPNGPKAFTKSTLNGYLGIW